MGDMFDLLDQPAEIKDAVPNAKDLTVTGERMCALGMCISGYDLQARSARKGVDIDVPAGQTVGDCWPLRIREIHDWAAVVPVSMMLGFRAGSAPVIRAMRDVTQTSLHRAIGVVPPGYRILF